MIIGIGCFMYPSQMASMRSHMGNPFERMDSNGDGSLDETEIGSMADKISEMTGESINASEIISKLDSDGDGLISEEEFKSGRPEGPPPGMRMGMMGGGMQGNTIQSLLDTMNESEDDDSSNSEDSLDANGDGIIDAEEAISAMKRLIQEYQNQMTSILEQFAETNDQLDLLV